MNAKVYRSGIVAAPETRGVESESYSAADVVKPEGRQGRMDGIFASPNLEGVLRWLNSNVSLTNCIDPFVRELTVDPETVFVYCIETWERCSSWDKDYEQYWATGVKLSEWLKNSENYDSTNWELLLAPADVLSVRKVTDKRIAAALTEDHLFFESLPTMLKTARRALKFA